MKFQINAKLVLDCPGKQELIHLALEPENNSMPSGTVITTIETNLVITTITGTMSVGRLLHTLDDLIATTVLAIQVDQSTSSE